MRELNRDDGRFFLKDTIRKQIDFRQTDQRRRIPPPPIVKPYPPGSELIALPRDDAWQDVGKTSLLEAIGRRRSHRSFLDEPLTLGELSFLLWATQGIRQVLDPGTALRTVPSAGARHALETYLGLSAVTDVPAGLYRYLPLEHALLPLEADPGIGTRLARAAFGQRFIASAAAVFVWTAVPYRMEWRYDRAAYKVIALDAGHAAQNLYLGCEAIGAGTCAVAAYDQDALDAVLGIDSEDEFTIYLAPVGRVVPAAAGAVSASDRNPVTSEAEQPSNSAGTDPAQTGNDPGDDGRDTE